MFLRLRAKVSRFTRKLTFNYPPKWPFTQTVLHTQKILVRHFPHSSVSFDFQCVTFRVTVEFRGIHALDDGDAGLIPAFELDTC